MPPVRRIVYTPGDQGPGPVKPDPPDDRDFKRLVVRLNELERELAVVTRALPLPQRAQPDDAAPAHSDARWHCKKCGYLLGFYDTQLDVLRTRYKEHIVYVRVGEGGFIQIVCRGCVEINTQGWVSDEDVAADPAG